jgi:hypothetical protein
MEGIKDEIITQLPRFASVVGDAGGLWDGQ